MVGVILLAAGASERLGTSKQLLAYKGTTLLQYVLNTIKAVDLKPVVLVLGAKAWEIKQSVGTAGLEIVQNDEWQEGMSSSIRKGIETLTTIQPGVDGVVIMVCDQPFVSPSLLQTLLNKRLASGKKIIASRYGHSAGVPVLFDKTFFPLLSSLKGQEGAKKIIQQHPNDVETVDFAEGDIDIDTAADYEKLKQNDTAG